MSNPYSWSRKLSDPATGIEASAVNILTRAVQLDTDRRHTEAMVCYQEGIDLLMQLLKMGTVPEAKKQGFRKKASEYMDRAEKLKKQVEKEKQEGNYHEQIKVESDSKNNGYQSVFGRFLDSTVTAVEVEDPFISAPHQIYNFLRFCEVLIKNCPALKKIHLITKVTENHVGGEQRQKLNELGTSLDSYGISLEVHVRNTMHDREIRINNGWIIKIGRGLDYFKPVPKFAIGYCDYDLRPCHETTIDIFHQKNLKLRSVS